MRSGNFPCAISPAAVYNINRASRLPNPSYRECAKANRITRKSACKLLTHHSLRERFIFLAAEAFVRAGASRRSRHAAKP
jgi:hypothetical protein